MAKIPLYYTFGNHMHWVDMQWLWGYHVLPGSIRDMLHFCRETGARGNVNFDGIGYEKLAAENPEALAELREAVQAGIIEPVGCSYGQPYGLFHGGESNIRQRVYGARAVRRLLGVWPKTFWEEEFDFFPQLPQMLRGCGFEYASLFFQWTWHTPEIPKEDVPVVWWEGQDGSKLLCATRNKLNLHQWPEDMDATFAELADSPPTPDASNPTPLILQWLELMPSPDWMCRSELLLPKMRELLGDERFEIKMATLGEYLRGMGVPPMVSSDVPSELLPRQSTGSEPELETRQGAYLPHWTKDGATYAVTFRLDDALPQHIQQQYAEERDILQKMHDQGRLKSTALAYELMRLRTEKVENALDAGYGSCLLKDSRCAEAVAGALKHFDGERYDLLAYVVMPNHVHAVLTPNHGHDLASILHSWKSFTAHNINKLLGSTGTVWQPEYYDHLIRGEQDLTNQIRYVLMNPESAGMPELPWVYKRKAPITPDHDRDGHGNHGRDAHATIPTRKYSMDEVWHGMSLGKNGDSIVRKSHEVERAILEAEALSSTLGLFGRPYAQWDVYPAWELEEAWRESLAAQHHDNHECEGLCGRVGWSQFERAHTIAADVLELQDANLTSRVPSADPETEMVVWNPLGWTRSGHLGCIDVPLGAPVTEVEAWGWAVMPLNKPRNRQFLTSGALTPAVQGGLVSQLITPSHPEGCLAAPLGTVTGIVKGKPVNFELGEVDREFSMSEPIYRSEFEVPDIADLTINYGIEDTLPALDINMRSIWTGTSPDPGIHAGWRMPIRPSFKISQVFADQPYGISEVKSGSKGHRKYPTGDWMTSPQWFEEVAGAFTSTSFVDLVAEDGSGLLVMHDGSQQFWLAEAGVDVQLSMLDPWDEARAESGFDANFRFFPHGPLTNAERWRLGQEFLNPLRQVATSEGGDLPQTFCALSCDAPNVLPTAFYRETEDFSGKHVEDYAGKGMGYPFVVRLVEFDGIETEATLTVGGTVAKAYKTNHLGQILEELGNPLTVKMRPYEIATIYMDIVEGRKQTRDLDAKREIWATVHRVDEA